MSLLCIVVETENAAYESFDESHAGLSKPAMKKLAQTATEAEIYAKPDKKNIASNVADIYSSVDKPKRKGFSTVEDA